MRLRVCAESPLPCAEVRALFAPCAGLALEQCVERAPGAVLRDHTMAIGSAPATARERLLGAVADANHRRRAVPHLRLEWTYAREDLLRTPYARVEIAAAVVDRFPGLRE